MRSKLVSQWGVFCSVVFLLWVAPATAQGPSSARTVWHVGPGFLITGGNASPGVGVALATQISAKMPLYVGIDSGTFFRFSPFGISFPALAMAYWRFRLRAPIVPTLGLSMGPILRLGSGTNIVDFMFVLNPGLQFFVDRDMDLFVRAAFGSVGSAFTLYPQFGATFRI